MDFSDKKKELLSQLSTMRQQKNMARKSAASRARRKDKETYEKQHREEISQRPPAIVYGMPGLFFGTMKSALAPYCEVIGFNDNEEATEYILANHTPIIMMDMDPPMDWRMCHDLFTTGKTMYPDTEYIIYQKDKTPTTEVQVLQAQGAHVLQKPIQKMELVAILKKILRHNEEE